MNFAKDSSCLALLLRSQAGFEPGCLGADRGHCRR